MSIIRLYTGSDGQTHIEALDPASHPLLTSPGPQPTLSFALLNRVAFLTGTMPHGVSTSLIWQARWKSAWVMVRCIALARAM